MAEASTSNEPTTSPPERPRREGNDSLWKRARRTLGTNSLTFLQPQSRPAGKSPPCPSSITGTLYFPFYQITSRRVHAMYSNLNISTAFRRQCRHLGPMGIWEGQHGRRDYANMDDLATTTSASGSGPAAPSKRREQVRHAQRYVCSFILVSMILAIILPIMAI